MSWICYGALLILALKPQPWGGKLLLMFCGAWILRLVLGKVTATPLPIHRLASAAAITLAGISMVSQLGLLQPAPDFHAEPVGTRGMTEYLLSLYSLGAGFVAAFWTVGSASQLDLRRFARPALVLLCLAGIGSNIYWLILCHRPLSYRWILVPLGWELVILSIGALALAPLLPSRPFEWRPVFKEDGFLLSPTALPAWICILLSVGLLGYSGLTPPPNLKMPLSWSGARNSGAHYSFLHVAPDKLVVMVNGERSGEIAVEDFDQYRRALTEKAADFMMATWLFLLGTGILASGLKTPEPSPQDPTVETEGDPDAQAS